MIFPAVLGFIVKRYSFLLYYIISENTGISYLLFTIHVQDYNIQGDPDKQKKGPW